MGGRHTIRKCNVKDANSCNSSKCSIQQYLELRLEEKNGVEGRKEGT